MFRARQGRGQSPALNPIRHLASLHSVKISGYCVNVCVANQLFPKQKYKKVNQFH